MKKCSRCKQERPLSMYGSKKDAPTGLRYECKVCQRRRGREHDRKPHRKTRNVSKSIYDKYATLHPHKRKAKNSVNNAIRAGKLTQQSCCVCKTLYQKETKAHAHHSDYNKPLDVMWLCPSHHKAWHRIFLVEEYHESIAA